MEIIQASDAVNLQNSNQITYYRKSDLTDFQLKLSEYLSKGNASELNRIRDYMRHSNELNENINPDNPPMTSIATKSSELQTDSENTRYLTNILGYSEPTIDPYTLQTIGFIDHPEYATGDGPDGYSTHLQATGWYDEVGGEAIAWGAMSDISNGRNVVHVVGKRGQQDYSVPPWYNYLIIGVSTNGYDWDYPIYCGVQAYDFQDITVGTTDIPFNYLAIFSWSPWGFNPVQKGSFYIDSVEVIVQPIPNETWLHVDARDSQYDGALLYPNIYVDGNLIGTGSITMQVDPGWHSIYVDETVWDPYFFTYANLWYISDNQNNGDYRWIDSSYYVTAWYTPSY